jgi:hypothetical protein
VSTKVDEEFETIYTALRHPFAFTSLLLSSHHDNQAWFRGTAFMSVEAEYICKWFRDVVSQNDHVLHELSIRSHHISGVVKLIHIRSFVSCGVEDMYVMIRHEEAA